MRYRVTEAADLKEQGEQNQENCGWWWWLRLIIIILLIIIIILLIWFIFWLFSF